LNAVADILRIAAVGTLIFLTAAAGCTSDGLPGSVPGAYGTSTPAAGEFSTLANEWLDGWASRHPSIAAGNGIHDHDGRLEDFSAAAVAQEIAWLRATKARLAAIPRADLPPDERVDHRILDGVIDGWLLELDVMKNHARNPMIYASAVADGVHNLMTMESAPAAERMRRVTSKLEGVGRLAVAARENLSNPPRVLVERGITMFEGASAMLAGDLAAAFPDPAGGIRDTMLVRAAAARAQIDTLISWLRDDLLPRATGPIALGAEYVQARYRAEELFDATLEEMLAIGTRELAREQGLFRDKIREILERDTSSIKAGEREPLAVWRAVRANHPRRGELVAATQRAVNELQAFVESKDLARIPAGEQVIVEASRPFDLGLASMHASPPLEPTPVKSIYYVTDANAEWPEDRQNAWLERFNLASLAITSAHEAMPGHFVHALYMRQTPGKLRRIWIGLNPFPQPSSGQDGWAHYAEHMVIEQGFQADDPRYALAQLSESMTRICRLIASINVHTGVWSIDEAASFFEQQAFVPGPAARQEATRVVYDPTNGGYFLGKRALLKLREDVRAKQGNAFVLRDFHERVMSDGIAPWWAHRVLMLGDSIGPVLQ
jgi:uncharacterized protein (DUF885 family)